jgi:hypothetical protein
MCNESVENINCIEQVSRCGGVIEPITVPECQVENEKPHVVGHGKIVAKVPVVIAEKTVQIVVEANIRLDREAMEIKRIRKNIFLTQCRLIPKGGFSCHTGKLFLKGYIRKNIEYATAGCVGNRAISGEIRHTTVNVPFHCCVPIEYRHHITPIFKGNEEPEEYQTFDPLNEGKDLRQQDFESTEYFNEKVFCELVKARFDEADIQVDGVSISENFPLESSFQEITEKLVVHLTFKLLQLQQVKISSLGCDD